MVEGSACRVRLTARGTVAVLSLLVLWLLGGCGTTPAPLAATPPPAPPPPATSTITPTPSPSLCQGATSYQGGGAYDGGWGCRPGVAVTVSRVLDAATFQLVDGRHVRLGGVVVREATSCGGQQALAATRAQVHEGQQVNMVVEPDAGTDPYGKSWVYLQVGQPTYATDLGRSLATSGFAEPFSQGANPVYVQAVAPLVDLARDSRTGQYGPPCGPPVPATPEPAVAPARAGNPHVHVDVDHHHNSRDGALTGGFCRRHWWC